MIELDIKNRIATVTLDQPPVNAINNVWLEDMDQVLDEVETRNDITIFHIKSALKVFCAGADLDLMRELLISDAGRDEMIEVIRNIQHVLFRIEALDIVTLAEIGGAAMGGGLELALACDLRIASNSARIGLPETGLGLIPAAGGTQRLPRIVGESIAKRLILGAEVIDGEEAGRLGLVQWNIVGGELPSFTDKLVKHLASLPTEAMNSCKRCINVAFDNTVNGYEMELQETRRLHDVRQTQQLIQEFMGKSK